MHHKGPKQHLDRSYHGLGFAEPSLLSYSSSHIAKLRSEVNRHRNNLQQKYPPRKGHSKQQILIIRTRHFESLICAQIATKRLRSYVNPGSTQLGFYTALRNEFGVNESGSNPGRKLLCKQGGVVLSKQFCTC